MRVNRDNQEPTKVLLKITADAADLTPIKNHVLGHFAGSVKVPGFRAGRAPAAMLEKHVDQQAFMSEVMDHAINELFRRAVDQEKLRPVSEPNVQLKKFVPYTDMEFEVTLDVIGDIKLPNYKAIKLVKPKVVVTAKDVDDVIKSLQQRAAERVEVDRPAKDGDEAKIDFKGTDAKGESVAGADGKDYPLLLGSKTFIPGFEDNVVGLKAGDHKEFKVTFPADYGAAALQNQKVTFSIDIKKVTELKEPKLDDAFAAKIGPFKSAADLKADIKKQLTIEKQQQADRQYENELIKNIATKTRIEIPENMIEGELLRMEEEEKRNLTYRGLTWQEHLQQENLTEEQHRDRHRPEAEERIRAGLALSEIADLEKIEVTPEELEVRIQILKGQYQDPAMQAELDKPENRQDIANRLLTEKTIAKIVSYTSA